MSNVLHALRRAYVSRCVERDHPSSVLFVCQGNLCRSPYAAARLSDLARYGERDVDVASAGFTADLPRPPKVALEAAAARGIDLSGHRAQAISRALVKSGELIVVMEHAHRTRIRQTFVSLSARVIMLGDLDPLKARSTEIADPILKSREFFDATYDRIDRCVTALAKLICGLDEPEANGAANLQHMRRNVRRTDALPLLARNAQTL